jgi:hypothetical protein
LPVIARIRADARYTLLTINGEQSIAEVSMEMLNVVK